MCRIRDTRGQIEQTQEEPDDCGDDDLRMQREL